MRLIKQAEQRSTAFHEVKRLEGEAPGSNRSRSCIRRRDGAG